MWLQTRSQLDCAPVYCIQFAEEPTNMAVSCCDQACVSKDSHSICKQSVASTSSLFADAGNDHPPIDRTGNVNMGSITLLAADNEALYNENTQEKECCNCCDADSPCNHDIDGDCETSITLECPCCRDDAECWSPLPSSSSCRSGSTDQIGYSPDSIFDDYPMPSVEATPNVLTRVPSWEYRPFHYYEPANPLFLDIKLKVLQMAQRRREKEELAAKSALAPVHDQRWQRAVQFAAYHRSVSAGDVERSGPVEAVPEGLRMLLRSATA